METLAQSVSTIAPTSTPAATIPLVAALAGNGTWLAYLFATIAILLVAWCVSRFAKYSASPGSLYTYASMILPPWMGAVAAWSLLLAYVATASSVIGGFYNFANLLAVHFAGREFSTVALSLLVTGASVWTAWRDVEISARLMLWIEAASLLVILAVVVPVLIRHGMHWDPDQIHLSGMTGSGLRLGLVLAMFSLWDLKARRRLARGAKSVEDHSARRAAVRRYRRRIFYYFVVRGGCRISHGRAGPGDQPAPMHVLAGVAGAPVLGLLIDLGAAVSLFAGTLGCITAAARVLLLMSHHGLAHEGFRTTHEVNDTPTRALLATGIAALLPVAILAHMGSNGLDVYGWMGSLATYGFIVTYALVCAALPRFLRNHGVYRPGARIISALAFVAMLAALAGNLYPVPEGPYGKMPYIYLAYLAAGMLWFLCRGGRSRNGSQSKT